MPHGIGHFLNTAEIQRLGRLALQSRYVVEGSLAGRHRSPLKGASAEFADRRAYIEGDDPKRIDWKVFGRTDRYYVRRFEDETNLRVYLIVDGSGSMAYGSGGITKFHYACRLAAALGYVVVKAHDCVGFYVCGAKIESVTAARNSLNHLNNGLKVLQAHQPGGPTGIAEALHRVAEDVRRRAMIVILSDLYDDEHRIVPALARFRRKFHDVIVFHLLDRQELDFDFHKGSEFEDLETQEVIAADPRALAPEYRRLVGSWIDEYRRQCSQLNVDYRLTRTDADLDVYVRAYLEERKRRQT
jgi:uncharacterized protein (DUF58 family)